MRRRLLALVVAALVGLGAPAAAPAADNAAVAINTKDGSSLFRFAFKIHRVAGEVVDEANAAVAWSTCTSCETTAIAIQIVLVMGDTTQLTPQNIALAVNQGCTLCETFASAYQFVLLTAGPVHFTSDGNKAIAEIKRAIRDLKDPALTPFDRQQRLDALMERLRQVLATELVPGGRPDEPEESEQEEHEQPATQPPATVETTETVTQPAETQPAPTTGETTTGETTTTP